MTDRIAFFMAILIGLGGCNPFWPPQGRGGLAETHPPPNAGQDTAAYAELEELVEELEALKDAGAIGRFPGQVAQAEHLVVRIQRALGGGLVQDAEEDVMQLRGDIENLSRRLQTTIQS
jgi:hypothetical protein